MRLAPLLLLLLASCPLRDQWHQAEETFGVRVLWGPQAGREDLADVLILCADSIDEATSRRGAGARLISGARVEFVRNADLKCAAPAGTDLGGCYWPDTDAAYVEVRPALVDSALCHELAHRARLRLGMGLDYQHAAQDFWRRFP